MRRAGRHTAAGFVLAGGRSSRMGTDKALLRIHGRTLIEQTASHVREAAGDVTIVADPSKYAHLGFPVIADRTPGCGPLGGIVTALAHSTEQWNLVVACDLPELDAPFLRSLIDRAHCEDPTCECVAPLGPTGPESLCAVYHHAALDKLQDALANNILKMRTVLERLETRFVIVPEARRFRNVNTPEDWAAHE